MTPHSALEASINKAGGQAGLAARLGVRQSLVWYWLKKSRRGIAAEHAPAVEAATGISRHDLRPDVFGPKPEAVA